MDFIRLKTRLIGDVRFARFQRTLGLSRAAALGTLAMVHFAWAQTEDDHLSAEDIDHAAECLGTAQAMLRAGLAESTQDGLVRVCGAREELDAMLKGRARGQKGADARWHKKSRTSPMPEQCGSNADAYAEERRGEKRREEERVAAGAAAPTREVVVKKRKPKEPEPEARELAALMAALIQVHTPEAIADPSKATEKWSRDIDLAIREDGREPHLLRECIEFAHASNDTFWRANILSGKKLREKVPTLVAQMRAVTAAPKRLTSSQLFDLADRLEAGNVSKP